MYYAVDKIIDDVIVLENLDTKEIIEIDKNLFRDNIHEGMILKEFNDNYIIDCDYEYERRKKLREKLNRLKNL